MSSFIFTSICSQRSFSIGDEDVRKRMAATSRRLKSIDNLSNYTINQHLTNVHNLIIGFSHYGHCGFSLESSRGAIWNQLLVPFSLGLQQTFIAHVEWCILLWCSSTKHSQQWESPWQPTCQHQEDLLGWCSRMPTCMFFLIINICIVMKADL